MCNVVENVTNDPSGKCISIFSVNIEIISVVQQHKFHAILFLLFEN